MEKQWYEELFADYAGGYDREPFTQGTAGEVEFLAAEMTRHRCQTVLDIGCGTGRHAIELARRGFRVTGIDLSAAQLARAGEKAQQAGFKVEFCQRDARDFRFDPPFDAAIMICEGAFPLMETDEMNYRILENAGRSLRAGGPFIFTTLNALFPMHHSVKEFIDANPGGVATEGCSFDWMTFRDHSTVTLTADSGNQKTLRCNERYYAPSEITWLLKSLHFTEIEIFGCELGHFSRNQPLTPDHFEMLVIARK